MSSVHLLLQISIPLMPVGKVGGWGWRGGGRKMDLLLIFPFFRMNSRENSSSQSNAWKSTGSVFHTGRATAGLTERAMLWSFETGRGEQVRCLLNLEHVYKFSLRKTRSFTLNFTPGIIPERKPASK